MGEKHPSSEGLAPGPRILVAIASHGTNNLAYLNQVLDGYRAMPFQIDLVVLSDQPKGLGDDVEVLVGLPSENPWSLPFAHKALFANRVEDYDLFIYSEDDMLVSAANIEAFLSVSEELGDDEIAGFLRFELDGKGRTWLPDFQSIFRWEPESARRRGGWTVASFTNEHAAFFLLTKAQLRKAIASGGFVREPYSGRYDMLCTAATDPYTSCGFRKVVPISALRDFLVHHLSNRYAGQVGLPLAEVEAQAEALVEIAESRRPAVSLCEVEPKIPGTGLGKNCYERSDEELCGLVSGPGERVLSFGSGGGDLEARLVKGGALVTAVPLDSVLSSAVEREGIETILAGSPAEAMTLLGGRRFDSVQVSNLLHLFSSPEEVIRLLAECLRPGGRLVIAGPNFEYFPLSLRGMGNQGRLDQLGSVEATGIRSYRLRELIFWLEGAGCSVDSVVWRQPGESGPRSGALGREKGIKRIAGLVWRGIRAVGIKLGLGRFVARRWVLVASKGRAGNLEPEEGSRINDALPGSNLPTEHRTGGAPTRAHQS